jgi:hypothetical protein
VKNPRLTAERLRRSRREREDYRRRSLIRRSNGRFHRDLAVVPHVFLSPDVLLAGELRAAADEVITALRGQAVWTLDTAARLACGRGVVRAADLTGYMTEPMIRSALDGNLVDSLRPARVSIDPVVPRPRLLIAHRVDALPAAVALPSGDLVVPWEMLIRDVFGTLGWRPDLLTRLEEPYQRALTTAAAPPRS